MTENFSKKLKMSEEDYHKLEHVGSSTLKGVAKSPAIFMQERIKNSEGKACFDIGHIFHNAILEPEVPHNFICAPQVDRRTKKGKADYAEFEEKNTENFTIVSYADWEKAQGMIRAFKETDIYKRMRAGSGESEATFIGKVNGIDAKVRIDRIRESSKGSIFYDLKTTKSIPQDDNTWAREILKYGYHIQDSWYTHVAELSGIKVAIFHFIFISKEPPYDYAVITLDEHWKALGKKQAMEALYLYRDCLETNHWPGKHEMSGVGSRLIEMPRWLNT